ncbi:MAG: Uma2 family endonuclease [Methylococcaceae bacterium]|nr:Uma2 family endonuclease [Methylococcaceae bacterium]
MTEAEYLALELTADVKHEYVDGHVYAMTGASNNHTRLTANVLGEFRNHLKGKPCEAFMTDTKIKVGKNYFYPDVVVDCSAPAGGDYFAQSPVIIVEVLSKTTQKSDLTTKLMQYINLPTLKEYVLIEQEMVRVQVLRKNNHWQSAFYFLGDEIVFEAIDLTLSVEDIYGRVDNNEMVEFRLAKGNVVFE